MKINNKGFAITAVLYGLLILFVILVSSYLLVLSARKNRVDNLVKDIEESTLRTRLTRQLLNIIQNQDIDSLIIVNKGRNIVIYIRSLVLGLKFAHRHIQNMKLRKTLTNLVTDGVCDMCLT